MSPGSRPRGTAALVGVASIGATAAGWLDGAAPAFRAGLVLLGAAVVPAYLLMPAARRFAGASAASAAAISFFLVLSLHAVASELMRSVGASFATYDIVLTWALLLTFLAVWVTSWRTGGYRDDWRAVHAALLRHRGLVLAIVALAGLAVWSRGTFTVEEDAFDHIGYVRRMVDFNAMRPEHTLAMPADASETMAPDPRKGALHPLIAWVSSTAGVGPDDAWSVLPVFMYPALVFAFIAFTRALCARASLVVVAGALFMLSYGGTAVQFAQAAAYGQNLAAGWYWVLVTVVLGDVRHGGVSLRARLFAAGVLAFGGALAHVGVAWHTGVLTLSLIVLGPWLGYRYRHAAIVALVVLGAAATAALVRLGFERPVANILHSHVQGVLYVGPEHFVMSPMEILRQFGMVFLGSLVLVPLVALAARRRRDARAVLALCAVPMVMAFMPTLTTVLYDKTGYMLARALLNAPVFAAAAIVVVAIVDGARRRGVAVRAAVALGLTLWALAFVRPAVDATRADVARRRVAGDTSLRALLAQVRSLPADAVILSDPATSYWLSAHGPHEFVAVYEQHGNPRDPYPLERLRAVRDVLSPFADVLRGVDACRRFGVDYVVLNGRALTPSTGFMTEWEPRQFEQSVERLRAVRLPYRLLSDDLEMESERYAIFEVMQGQPAVIPADRPVPPVVATSAGVVGCGVMAPSAEFEVTGIVVSPPFAAPGDSVTIALSYRRDINAPFAIPSLMYVRFDHETITEATPFIGDKYARRFDERRGGYVKRFRADLRPGHGVFEPDLWPIGTPLREVFSFAVPPHAQAGHYRVEFAVERESMLPNFHARDLLYNRDHYSGKMCAAFDVRPRGEVRE